MEKSKTTIDKRVLLSTLWVFVLINMIYADIIGMLRPGYIELLDSISKQLTSGTVLTFSILMEVPILMILLSRILPRKTNRIANFIAIPISILYVIYGGLDNPPISYLFFASVEIIAMFVICYFALMWKKETIKTK